MDLNYVLMNPAGNLTVVVISAVPLVQRQQVAKALLSDTALAAEQVGFLAAPKFSGQIRLEMMGGEFCGNALRSIGYYYAATHGLAKTQVLAEISGASGAFGVTVDVSKHIATTQMPLPTAIEQVAFSHCNATAVAFSGIIHYIVAESTDAAVIDEADMFTMAHYPHMGAFGVMFVDTSAPSIRPAVYVRDTETLYYETSCASGSAATAVALSVGMPDGMHHFSIRQPGSVLTGTVQKENACIVQLTISGDVHIEKSGSLSV